MQKKMCAGFLKNHAVKYVLIYWFIKKGSQSNY